MRAVTSSNSSTHTEQLKTIARDMGEKLTSRTKRAWYLEFAISATIFFLGTAILLTSAQVI